MCRPRDVEERFVDGDTLDDGSEVVEHRHHVVAAALILAEVTLDEHEPRAELASRASRPSRR